MGTPSQQSPNPYLPHLATLVKVADEAPEIKTFAAQFQSQALADDFQFKPGQFIEVSVFGHGECPFGLARGPGRPGPLIFSVARMGKVTSALHGLSEGDTIGIRGPFGNGFPMEEHEGKSLVIVAGGIGMPPLRSVVEYALDHRDKYDRLLLIYGARTPELLCYKELLREWDASPHIEVVVTVDEGDENWTGRVGVVTVPLGEIAPSPQNAVAYTVGPPIMLRFVIKTLLGIGFGAEQIYASLEARMKCGLGKCGRCNVGPKLVCLDGPVFSQAQLERLGASF
jgi:NAD(P)H-flavin reductase